jgi:hypothetical protein
MGWEHRKGRSFGLVLVQRVFAFVLVPASGVDAIGECPACECPAFEYPAFEYPVFGLPDQLGKALVPQCLYSWGEVKIFSAVKNQRTDALRRCNVGKVG